MDFLSADRASGHGVGADLALIDEAGLLQERHRPLWNAVMSAISGRDGRFVSISIKGDGPMFSEMSDRSDEIVYHEYTSSIMDSIIDEGVWRAANPGLQDGIKSVAYMRRMARRAELSPTNEADFRAFDLNQPLSPTKSMICSIQDWVACTVADAADLPERLGPCYVGIDIGGSASMTCAFAFWPASGRGESFAALPGEPTLLDRGLADGVGRRYLTMELRKELRTFPGFITPVVPFLTWVFQELSSTSTIAAVGADSYRKAEVREYLRQIAAPYPVFWRGTGSRSITDSSHDITAWQKLVKGGRMRHKNSLLMDSAIIGSNVEKGPQNLPKLEKRKATDRIDILSASVIAAGLAAAIQTYRMPETTVIHA